MTDVCHDEHGEQQHGPNEVGEREVDLPEQAAPDRPDEHRGARDLCPRANTRSRSP